MNINILENGDISIPYMRSNGMFQFTDAIILKSEDFATLTPEDIRTMQDNRFASWVEHVIAASEKPTVNQSIIDEESI